MKEIDEFERIVDFCFIVKQSKFVVRFLDGSTCALETADLPKKMQTKKPQWEDAYLSRDQSSLVVRAGKDLRYVKSHIIRSKGKEIV